MVRERGRVTLALEILLRSCAGCDREPLGNSNVTALWHIRKIDRGAGKSYGEEQKLGSHMSGTKPGPVTP